jgi:hypothetical protein
MMYMFFSRGAIVKHIGVLRDDTGGLVTALKISRKREPRMRIVNGYKRCNVGRSARLRLTPRATPVVAEIAVQKAGGVVCGKVNKNSTVRGGREMRESIWCAVMVERNAK